MRIERLSATIRFTEPYKGGHRVAQVREPWAVARRWPGAMDQNHSVTLEELELMLRERDRPWPEVWAEKGEKQGIKKGLREGRREGRKEGRKVGRIELLERQLEAKFGPLDDSVRSRLHGASSRQLLTWGTRLVTAEALDEVFG